MKKKILLILVCGVLIVGIVIGVGNLKNNDKVDTNNPTENKEQVKDEKNIVLSNSYKIPGKNIVVDVPDYQSIEKGFTKLYILHGIKYIAVTANKSETVTELMKAHEVAFKKFKENIQNYSYVKSISIKNGKKDVINDIEVYRYEGTLNCGRDTVYDAYVIGYSFVMDGVPCTITGSVIDQAQSKTLINEVRNTVDAMIKTLRSEK